MTVIRTAKSRYTVQSVTCPVTGPAVIHVRQPSGKLRALTRKDTGRPRFDAALAHWYRKGAR